MATVTHGPLHSTGKAVVLGECDSIHEAEDLIAVFEQVDPKGVREGNYGIDCTEAEDAHYQLNARRTK